MIQQFFFFLINYLNSEILHDTDYVSMYMSLCL